MYHFCFVDWEIFLQSFLPFELNIHLFHTNFSSCKMKHACIIINVRKCIMHVNFVTVWSSQEAINCKARSICIVMKAKISLAMDISHWHKITGSIVRKLQRFWYLKSYGTIMNFVVH